MKFRQKVVPLCKFNWRLEQWTLEQHLSPPQRLKGFFSGGVDPLSNVSAGTELQATAESAGASARYHTQDGRHPGETISFHYSLGWLAHFVSR